MSNVLWNIEALDQYGRSLGVADVVTFKKTEQKGVVLFQAVWPTTREPGMVRVVQVRIEGKMMDLEKSVVVAPGDVLRINGLCNAQWATREGKLDG